MELVILGVLLGAPLGFLHAWFRQRSKGLSRSEAQEMLSLLRALEPKVRVLDAVLEDWPRANGVLNDILSRLTRNGGKTMADAVARIDTAAVVSAAAASESAKAAARLTTALGLVDAKVTLGVSTAMRTENNTQSAAAHAKTVATNLSNAQTVLEGVASDLANDRVLVQGVAHDLDKSHSLARAVGPNAPDGAAADAGMRGDTTNTTDAKQSEAVNESP